MPSRSLLIVDDEPANLEVMRRVLSPSYSLVFAHSGAAALAAARKHLPSLILLDIQMPDMDGYEVCRQLKADATTQHTPVIFVTNLADAGQEAAGFEVGAVDYIVKPVSPAIVLARVATHLSLVKSSQLERSYIDAITMLGQVGHFHDEDTGEHIWRMAAYARRLAAAIGWDLDRCKTLELAAPMHDTGKIAIPDRILRKPGKLDADEWEIMKSHAQVGHDVLIRSEAPVFQLAAEIALRHHERWDGSGYPDGLAGTQIPESARIVAVADVFDALSMRRPYKEPWSKEKVIDYIQQGSGKHFEPRLVDVFLDILPSILDIQDEWRSRES